ncbi:hypothetical protein ACFYVL_33750 [Streptomyces sp. NPDC004111]|uniref:hypothetical protein n=1 Tax=Streptomyces sp. NPDC004111 TaxID=3364690 RepID=UPI0036CF65D5
MTHNDDEVLQDAVARCQAVERVLEDAQRRYRRAQEESARAEAERVRAEREVARAESTVLALLAQQSVTVAALTEILERQAPRRRLWLQPSAADGWEGNRRRLRVVGPVGEEPHGSGTRALPPQ